MDLLKEKMKTKFDCEYKDVVTLEPLIYGDFMVPNVENKQYIEITDHQKVIVSPLTKSENACHAQLF